MGVVLNELERDIALTRTCGVNNSSFAVFVHHLARGHVSIRIMLIQIQRHIAHAEKRGESINGFVGRAISETMQRDIRELPGAGQTDPDTESKRAAFLEKLQGVAAGDDSKE